MCDSLQHLEKYVERWRTWQRDSNEDEGVSKGSEAPNLEEKTDDIVDLQAD